MTASQRIADGRFFLRAVAYLLVLLVPLAACTVPDTSSDNHFSGAYVWGHEVNTFQSCGDAQIYWVSASAPVLDQLRAYHDSVPGKPYRAIYISFRGKHLEEESDGFAAQYDGLVEVSEVMGWEAAMPPGCGIE